MTTRFKPLLAGLLLSCSQAHAGVLYTWHSTGDPQALPQGLTLEIEFSEAAVASGSVHYVIDNCGMPEYCGPDPDAPVTRFLFDGVTPPIHYAPGLEPMHPFASLLVSVRFEANGYLSGSIWANDTASQIAASSAGTLFTIDGVRSDAGTGGGCDPWGDDCHGATGYLRTANALASHVAIVPEPGMPALFATGLLTLLGLGVLKRRT